MKNRWTKTILVGVLVVMVIAVGAIVVFAQGGGSAPADDVTPAPLPRDHWRGHYGDFGYQQQDLADELGITVEQLEAAQREAKMKQIERAVDEGYLTVDQGNLMLAMVSLKDSIDQHALLAAALDLDVADLEAAVEDGTLHELLADVTPQELRDGMQEAFDAALQDAVDNLVITEEQAELVRDHLGGGFGMGFHHGFGPSGPHGPGFGNSGGGYPGMRSNSSLPGRQNF